MAGGVVVACQMQRIDLSRDAPDGNTVAIGEPERNLGMLEKELWDLSKWIFRSKSSGATQFGSSLYSL